MSYHRNFVKKELTILENFSECLKMSKRKSLMKNKLGEFPDRGRNWNQRERLKLEGVLMNVNWN